MSSLKYVGRTPTSDAHLVAKGFADQRFGTRKVDETWVNAQISAEAAAQNLQTQIYVDNQDNLRAKKADVDAADLLYVPTTELGAANGVASLDSSGSIPTGQLPAGLRTERVVASYNAATHGTIFLAPGNTRNLTTTTLREYRIATIPVPDPGFPWIPFIFGVVHGCAGGADPGQRDKGNGNFGLFTVMPPSGVSDTVYGVGIATAVYSHYSPYMVIPAAPNGATPASFPAVTGALTLDLYGCCWAGNPYVIRGDGLVFTVSVIPAVA